MSSISVMSPPRIELLGDARVRTLAVAPVSGPDEDDEFARQMNLRLGANVRALRQARGLTQEQLGEATGQGRVYVQRIEGGTINATLKTLVSLSRALACSVEDLVRAQEPSDATLHIDVPVGSYVAPAPNTYAIEFPSAVALDVAKIVARHLGKSIPLLEQPSRTVTAIIGPGSRPRAPSDTSDDT